MDEVFDSNRAQQSPYTRPVAPDPEEALTLSIFDADLAKAEQLNKLFAFGFHDAKGSASLMCLSLSWSFLALALGWLLWCSFWLCAVGSM